MTLDNQIQSDFTTGPLTHKVLFGADYQYKLYDTQGAYGGGTVAGLDIFQPVYGSPATTSAVTYDRRLEQQQFGLYLQDQIKLGSWSLLLGGRHDWAETDTENRISNTTTKTSDRAFTGRAGLVYQFSNGLAPYASYAESFFPVNGTNAAGQQFEPETGVQYEVGLRYEPPGSNSLVSIAVFDLRRQNVTTSDPDNPGFNIQTGEITSRGIELEAKLSLGYDINLLGAYSFNDVEVTKSNGTDLGKRPSRVPEHTASLWAEYSPDNGLLRGWNIGGGARYVGSTYGDSTNSFKVPSFLVFDSAVSFELETLSPSLKGARLEINATNLLNKEYVATCGSINGCHFGARRAVYGTLRYSW